MEQLFALGTWAASEPLHTVVSISLLIPVLTRDGTIIVLLCEALPLCIR